MDKLWKIFFIGAKLLYEFVLKDYTMGNMHHEEINTYVHMLFRKFNSLTLSAEEVANVTQRSKASLRRDREDAVGIPVTKLGPNSGSSKVLYSIYDVAKFVVEQKSKVR